MVRDRRRGARRGLGAAGLRRTPGMKSAFVLFALVLFASLVILAVVFRSKTARDLLRLLRNMAYAWIVLVVVLAIFELRRRGL